MQYRKVISSVEVKAMMVAFGRRQNKPVFQNRKERDM